MIGLGAAVRVMVSTRPVDFRKGAEGLAALVREEMKSDPFSRVVYVFRAKRADRVKLSIGTAPACVCSQRGWRTASSIGPISRPASFVCRPRSSQPCSIMHVDAPPGEAD